MAISIKRVYNGYVIEDQNLEACRTSVYVASDPAGVGKVVTKLLDDAEKSEAQAMAPGIRRGY